MDVADRQDRQAQTRALLEAWSPGAPLARQWHARALELSDASRSCDRDHFVPGHFTASAFVLCPAETQLLLIFHDKLARWLQPGGHIERDDADLLGSARREVAEETGLDSDELELRHEGLFDLDIHDIPARGREPGHAHFDLRFLFRAPHRAVRVGDGVRAVEWVALSRAAELDDASVRRVASQLLARLE